jgi:hypothetical protein
MKSPGRGDQGCKTRGEVRGLGGGASSRLIDNVGVLKMFLHELKNVSTARFENIKALQMAAGTRLLLKD